MYTEAVVMNNNKAYQNTQQRAINIHANSAFHQNHRRLPEAVSARDPPARRPVQMVHPAVKQLLPSDADEVIDISEMKNATEEELEIMEEMQFRSNEARYAAVRRRKRDFVPDNMKNPEYWVKRIKNNMAAKRSREKRRIADVILEGKVSKLAQENEDLRNELACIKNMVQERLTGEPREEETPQIRTVPVLASGPRPSEIFNAPPPVKRPRLIANPPQQVPLQMPPHMHAVPPYRPPLRPILPRTVLSAPQLVPVPRDLAVDMSVTSQRVLHPLHQQDWSNRSLCGVARPPFQSQTRDNPPSQVIWSELPNMAPRVSQCQLDDRLMGTRVLLTPPSDESNNEPMTNRAANIHTDKVIAPSVNYDHDSPQSQIHSDTDEDETSSEYSPRPREDNHSPVSAHVSKDSEPNSCKVSHTPQDVQSRLSPSEINKLPHKLRARMLRSISHPKDTSDDNETLENTREPAMIENKPKSPPPTESSLPIMIKQEKIDEEYDDSPAVADYDLSQHDVGAGDGFSGWVQPKQEYPMVGPCSIEEEIEQARTLTPDPSRVMTAEETAAFAELMKAASDLVGARLQSNDFMGPSKRQLGRGRCRVLNESDRYLDKRLRNNIAAKKCRDAKRLLVVYRTARSNFFEVENISLRNEMEARSKEVARLRELVRRGVNAS